MKYPTAIVLASGMALFVISAAADDSLPLPAPAFHLSFTNGLTPEIGPDNPGKWTGVKPPQFHEQGLDGPALLVGDMDGNQKCPQVTFDPLPGTHDSGTMLFWVRGLKNWDLYRTAYSQPPGPSQNIALGGGTMWRWNHDTFGVKLYAGTPGRDYRQIAYPGFHPYRWTQLGYTWQNGHVCLYLNGELVNENAQFGLGFGPFALGGGAAHADSLRLYDNLKIWNRSLDKAEVKRLYRRDMQLATRPRVTAARLPAAPTLDGRVGTEEWAGAARITGLLEAKSGERAADQSAFYLGYDDTHLYLAMTGDFTEVARVNPALVYEKFLKVEGDPKQDDLIEAILAPDYFRADLKQLGDWTDEKQHPQCYSPKSAGDTFIQSRPVGDWREFRFLANGGEWRKAVAFGPDAGENKPGLKWETASSASSAGWQFEARIPLAALADAPKPGDEWGLQLARLWRHLKQENDLWAWGHRQPDGIEKGMHARLAEPDLPAGMGILRFGAADEPVVRVLQTGALDQREVDWRAEIVNPASEARNVQIRLFTDLFTENDRTGERTARDLMHEETLSVPAGERVVFNRRHRMEDVAASRIIFEVANEAGTNLHRSEVAFYLEQRFKAELRRFPNYGRMTLDLDLLPFAPVPAEELRVDLSLNNADGKRVLDQPDRKVRGYTDSLDYDTAAVTPGDYTLHIVIRHGDKVLAEEEQDYTQAPKAAWYGNRHGFEDVDQDVVPYPWTDMVVTSRPGATSPGISAGGVAPAVQGSTAGATSPADSPSSVSVWGREYTFGAGLLPEQITTLKQPILRAPMRLVAETAGGERVALSPATGTIAWTKKARTRVEGAGLGQAGGVSCENAVWAEYDGLLWNTLTLRAEAPLEVTKVWVEAPLTPAFTDVDYRNWYGNGDGGVQFFGGKTELIGAPEGGTVRITLLDKPVTLGKEGHPIEFGLIASPVRPKTWRTPEHIPAAVQGGGPWFPAGLEFMPAADIGVNYYGTHGRIYVHTNPLSRGEKDALGPNDFDHYAHEWLANPNERILPAQQRIEPTLHSRSYRDYFVWRHWRYQNKYGFGGLYYDNPQQDGLGTREVIKRMYNITLADRYLGAREQAIGMAVNGGLNLSFMGFITYHWDGENLNSVVQNWKTYIGKITPESFRGEYMGHNLGFPVCFLGQNRLRPEWVEADGGPEAVYDHLSGLSLLHDAMLPHCPLPSAMNAVERRVTGVMDRLDFNHWVYQFTPYWQQDIVQMPTNDMHASFYIARPSVLVATDPAEWMSRTTTFRNYFRMAPHLPQHIVSRFYGTIERERKYLETLPDRAVLIVYNHSDWEGEMRLKPDWKKLGLGAPETLQATNAVHSTGFRLEKTGAKDKDGKEIEKAVFFPRPEETAKIENGELVFPMTKWNYRMIVIEKAK